jgi:hypothetical protein
VVKARWHQVESFFKEHLMPLCSISRCMFGTEEQYMQQWKEIYVFPYMQEQLD